MAAIRRNYRTSPTPFFGIRSYILFVVALALLMVWAWMRYETGEKNTWLLFLSGAVALLAFGLSVYGIYKQFKKRKNG